MGCPKRARRVPFGRRAAEAAAARCSLLVPVKAPWHAPNHPRHCSRASGVESRTTRWHRSSRGLSRSRGRCRAVLHPLSRWASRGATVVFSGEPANGVERAFTVGSASSRRIAGLERPAPACRPPPKRPTTSPPVPPGGTEVSAKIRSEERLGTTVGSCRSLCAQGLAPEGAAVSQRSCVCPPQGLVDVLETEVAQSVSTRAGATECQIGRAHV